MFRAETKVPALKPEPEPVGPDSVGSGDDEGSGEVMMADSPSINYFSEFDKAKKVCHRQQTIYIYNIYMIACMDFFFVIVAITASLSR